MPVIEHHAEPKRFELTTAKGGYVCIRPLTYEEVLERRDKAGRVIMDAEQRRGRNAPAANQEMKIDLMQQATREYEFAHQIVEHNLELANGQLVNFAARGMLARLDSRVCTEIEMVIDEINREPELENSEATSELSSMDESTPDSLTPQVS